MKTTIMFWHLLHEPRFYLVSHSDHKCSINPVAHRLSLPIHARPNHWRHIRLQGPFTTSEDHGAMYKMVLKHIRISIEFTLDWKLLVKTFLVFICWLHMRGISGFMESSIKYLKRRWQVLSENRRVGFILHSVSIVRE